LKKADARWFGGRSPGSAGATLLGARLVWSDPPLWTAGDWAPEHVRTAERPDAKIAVFGPCSASEHELARALTSPNLAAAAGSWAGSYTVVRASMGGPVEVLADAAGAGPLYTARTPHGLVWGSSSLALSPLAGGSVDTEWIAAYVRDKHSPPPGRSAWTGVEPVPAGHLLMLRVDGTTSMQAWWSPIKRLPDDTARTLRWALGEGVRVRVEGVPVSTDLAGMDSSTLALLAAQYGPTTGVTLHPSGVTEGGDLQYAQALNVPGLHATFFPLEERHLPFAPADVPLPATDEPAPSTAVWAMFAQQLQAMAAAGSARHLTGDGGDDLFMPAPTHLANLARRGHWLRLMSDAMDWARLRKQSPRPLIAAAFRANSGSIGRTQRPRPAWLNVPVPVRANTGGGVDAAFVASMRNTARTAYSEIQLADAVGIELHNPYFDAAVLDAVVSASAEQRFSARRYKPLLADTFADMLPEAHRMRAAKGVFAGDFHRGLRTNLRRVLDLTDGHLAALGIIDPDPLRATVHAAALGAQTQWPPLLATLAAEAWIRAADGAASTTWTMPAPAGAQ
jgi:asparagine synthase (glutamine-hydrolysing)